MLYLTCFLTQLLIEQKGQSEPLLAILGYHTNHRLSSKGNLFLTILESRNSKTKAILFPGDYHLPGSKIVTYSLCSHIEVRSGEGREMGIRVPVPGSSSYKGINAIRINLPFT